MLNITLIKKKNLISYRTLTELYFVQLNVLGEVKKMTKANPNVVAWYQSGIIIMCGTLTSLYLYIETSLIVKLFIFLAYLKML